MKYQRQSTTQINPQRNKSAASLLFLFSLMTYVLLFSPSLAGAMTIESRAAVVMNTSTGQVLYAKDPELRLMPASTTKLMTALLVVENRDLNDLVTVSRKASSVPATVIGLKTGDRVTVGALLNAALIKSANDAAVALAEAVAGTEEEFVLMMNRKAAEMGLVNTRFINPNGLPGPGQYITAFDLVKLMRQAIEYPELREILGTPVAEVSIGEAKSISVKNTNQLLLSDTGFLWGKTGYTREAKHCFVSAGVYEDSTIIIALLGNPVRSLLWKETEDLMALGTRVLNNIDEPVIYITQSDADAEEVTNASFTVKTPVKKTNKKKKQVAL
jgi:serine-type D-Ala-D-Ala carboxypeptidase (penicillin-binding protein 5/6)